MEKTTCKMFTVGLFIIMLAGLIPSAFAEKTQMTNEMDSALYYRTSGIKQTDGRGSEEKEALAEWLNNDYSFFPIMDHTNSLNSNGIIDPDSFSGADADKIELAMEAIGQTGHGVITINRLFTLDRDVYINHSGRADSRIIFQGMGNQCGFNMGSHSFKASDNNTSYGMLSFTNLKFHGTGIIFLSDYLIRLTFENCIFDGGVNVVQNGRTMQSWSFNNCTIRKTTSYVVDNTSRGKKPGMNDVIFHGCLIEECAGFISAQDICGVSIMQCCIEGLTDCVCKVSHEARMLSVIGNYFEHNNNRVRNPNYIPGTPDNVDNPQYVGNGGEGVHFDFTGLQTNRSSITISSNLFLTRIYLPDKENNMIVLPPSDINIGNIIVENNNTSKGNKIYLVKADSKSNRIYSDVYLNNNDSNYNGGENNLLIDSKKANLGNINVLTGVVSLNTITHPGVYYADAAMIIEDRPDPGEFYLIHFRRTDGFAQIAITEDGIKSRIGDGDWQ